MDCNISHALINLDPLYKSLEHNGQSIHRHQAIQILTQALKDGYEYISEIPDADIERVINKNV